MMDYKHQPNRKIWDYIRAEENLRTLYKKERKAEKKMALFEELQQSQRIVKALIRGLRA